MKNLALRGFTLAEMLVVVVILAVLAGVAIPLLSSGDPQKLTVAAEETANVLRLAVSEARRADRFVLVDGLNAPGHLLLYFSSANGNLNTPMLDPQTKRTLDLSFAQHPFANGVTLSPRFMAGGSPRPQLLIGPGAVQLWGFNGAGSNQGVLQANSSVRLGLGSQSVDVRIDSTTGRVTLP